MKAAALFFFFFIFPLICYGERDSITVDKENTTIFRRVECINSGLIFPQEQIPGYYLTLDLEASSNRLISDKFAIGVGFGFIEFNIDDPDRSSVKTFWYYLSLGYIVKAGDIRIKPYIGLGPSIRTDIRSDFSPIFFTGLQTDYYLKIWKKYSLVMGIDARFSMLGNVYAEQIEKSMLFYPSFGLRIGFTNSSMNIQLDQ